MHAQSKLIKRKQCNSYGTEEGVLKMFAAFFVTCQQGTKPQETPNINAPRIVPTKIKRVTSDVN